MLSTPYTAPDSRGYFGAYGGRYVPETLISALDDLSEAYEGAKLDREFQDKYLKLLKTFAGRPTPLYFAERLTTHYGSGKIYLKREDLCHTGAHKLNNTIGQILLAKRLGKSRVIAETGAGQHGVATATVCAMMGLQCVVYMGTEDIARQSINVSRMKLLGAQVVPVSAGTRTLKDATNEALRDWVTNVETTFYVIGSVVGPHPYPAMVRDFQSVIGREARKEFLSLEGRLPSHLLACVGGGSNAIGLFHAFLDDDVAMIGVEAAGNGIATGKHAATLSEGKPGVLHGSLSYLLQDEHGQVLPAHSISAGLDYPGVGPESSFLRDANRVRYVAVTDGEALAACLRLTRLEGILSALESSHALAYLEILMPTISGGECVIINLSGRGEKDLPAILSSDAQKSVSPTVRHE